jgi:hypothetical protein
MRAWIFTVLAAGFLLLNAPYCYGAQDVYVIQSDADVSRLPPTARCLRFIEGSEELVSAASKRCVAERVELCGGNFEEGSLKCFDAKYGLQELAIHGGTVTAETLGGVKAQMLILDGVSATKTAAQTVAEEGVAKVVIMRRIEPFLPEFTALLPSTYVRSVSVVECNVTAFLEMASSLAETGTSMDLSSLAFESCQASGTPSLKWITTVSGLKTLSLFHCRWLSDEQVAQLSDASELRTLLLGSTLVTDKAMSSVAAASTIEALDISGCYNVTSVGVRELTSLHLVELDISYHRRLGEYALATLVHLQTLSCVDVELDVNALKAISQLPRLRSLSLAGSKLADRSWVEPIVGLADSLDTLDLARCSWVDDIVLGWVSQLHLVSLLNLWGNAAVTDVGVKKLAMVESLVALELSGCQLVTDASAEVFVQMKRLEDLRLSGCSLLTDETLKVLARSQTLRILSVIKCPLISRNAVEDYCETRPGVTVDR